MHAVVGIRYENDKVTAICSCDWESKKKASETEARAEHDKHVEKAGS